MEFLDLLDVPMHRRTVLLGTGLSAFLAACGSSATKSTSPAVTDASTAATAVATTTAPNPEATTTAPAGTPTTVAAAATTPASGLSALTAADFDGQGTCVLAPEKTAGPFPLDEQLDRSDITEGIAGHPLRLGLRVVDADCTPISQATVEIWHTDSTGDYSAYVDGGGGKDDGPGTTFCRGTQAVNADGIAEFLTVYPGWYNGRAVHIHLRVHVDDHIALTSQLFFDDDYTAAVYADAPYAEFGLPNVLTGADGIAGNAAAEGTILTPSRGDTANGPGSIALHNLGVDPAAVSTGGPGGGGPGGPPQGSPGGPPPGGPRPGDPTTTSL
jgi:protocatechuate 3,4-dioxygenase beta subunit